MMTSAENSSNSTQRPDSAPSADVAAHADIPAPSPNSAKTPAGSSAAGQASASSASQPAPSLGSSRSLAGASPGSGSRPSDATFVTPSPPYVSPTLTAVPATADLVGQRLDHFEILELIGGGGMGLVYRARDTALDRIVAVKILSMNRAADDETIRRFRNEAQSAARLDHENIARVYYVGEARGLSGLNYIVLEYIDGTNLRDLVAAQGPLPIDQVLAHALQLAHALDHASSRNVVHRDIKPSNVLVTREGRAKLVDMGLSRLQEPGSDEDLTASGVTLGTFDYISPEQARDPRNADVRSDIYSLGCTLFYLLTGQPPFPGGNAMQKLLQHQGDEPPSLAQLNPAMPEGLSRIVRKMLAKDPQRRYQDAHALIVDLSLLCAQLGIELPSVGVTLLLPIASPWRQAIHRFAPWLVAAAALVATIVLLDRLWARRSGDIEAAAPQVQPLVTSGRENAGDKPEHRAGKQPSPGANTVQNSGVAKEKIELVAPPWENEGDRAPSLADAAGSRLALGAGGGLKLAGGAALTAGEDGLTSTRLAAQDAVRPNSNSPLAAPPPSNVLVVDPASDGSRPYEFLSLKAAAEKLDKDRNTIELRYSGRPKRGDVLLSEMPLKLTKLGNVTIRAARNYRPVIVFEPTSADETAYAPQMIALSDVQLLTLANVAIELRSPPQTSRRGGWALASLLRSNVELQSCTLTASCATDERRKVSFFAVEGEMPSSAMMMMSMEMGTPEKVPVSIKLRDCIARGDAALIRASQPVELDWTNGLATLSEPLFVGDAPMHARGGRWSLELDHVTGHLRSGLCALTSAAQMLETKVSCHNSILICPSDVPLFRTQGDDTHTNLKNKLTWSGYQNLYEGVRTFWNVSDVSGRQPPEEMSETAWQGHWSAGETPAPRDPGAPLGWRLPPELNSKPLRDRAPSDYALRRDSPAADKADGKDIGFRLDDLPKQSAGSDASPAPSSPAVSPGPSPSSPAPPTPAPPTPAPPTPAPPTPAPPTPAPS